MFEQTAVVEMQVEEFGGLFAGRNVLDGKEPCLAVRERESLGEQKRRIRAVGVHRPLQTAEALEAIVLYPRKQRSQPSNFIHDLGGMRVAPVTAHAVGDELNDLSVRFGFAERLHCLIDS